MFSIFWILVGKGVFVGGKGKELVIYLFIYVCEFDVCFV